MVGHPSGRCVEQRGPSWGRVTRAHKGFDLHAGLCVPADERDRLERIARYALRPPVAQDRLQWTDDGQIRLALRRPWSDGTAQLLFDPVELLERLAALTPRPRIHLLLYHGVLAPRAVWRSLVVQFGSESRPDATGGNDDAEEHVDAVGCRHGHNYLWAELMRRRLGLDVLACPRCDGRLKLIALIDDPAVIRRLLRHLELPTEVPEARPARAPPVPLLDSAPPTGGALDEVFVDDSA
ncbi:MAG: transposase [Acidobacteria bacterium]|nr:transposase [Acidobacteriota bacterium]